MCSTEASWTDFQHLLSKLSNKELTAPLTELPIDWNAQFGNYANGGIGGSLGRYYRWAPSLYKKSCTLCCKPQTLSHSYQMLVSTLHGKASDPFYHGFNGAEEGTTGFVCYLILYPGWTDLSSDEHSHFPNGSPMMNKLRF